MKIKPLTIKIVDKISSPTLHFIKNQQKRKHKICNLIKHKYMFSSVILSIITGHLLYFVYIGYTIILQYFKWNIIKSNTNLKINPMITSPIINQQTKCEIELSYISWK